MPPGPTASLRVMIVEDEIIVAFDLAGMFEELGHSVVKMANRVDIAQDFAQTGTLDLAVLDINVRGVVSFPIATTLRDRGIPFIFASGYGQRGLIDGFRDACILNKPYSVQNLSDAVERALSFTA